MGFLPAYFPLLNPDELVWNHAKAEVSKRPITSTLEMESRILSAIHSTKNRVGEALRLPDTVYAWNMRAVENAQKLRQRLIFLGFSDLLAGFEGRSKAVLTCVTDLFFVSVMLESFGIERGDEDDKQNNNNW